MSDFLAIDWGTTNRRVFYIRDGNVIRTDRDDRGVTAIPKHGFQEEVAGIRARFGDLPILMAGMVGSNIGWQAAPYVPTPATLADLAAALLTVAPATRIIPGVRTSGARADVMRGEEVQLLGAVSTGLAPADALLCQPGTHCKWARMNAGAIVDFTTAMTGELFALLRGHGLLAPQLQGTAGLGDAFDAGVAEGARRDLPAALFGIRAAGLLGLRDDADAASYASGLLIGADVAARLADHGGDPVYILAGPDLGGLYARAIVLNGGTSVVVDSHAAFAAGITAIHELTP